MSDDFRALAHPHLLGERATHPIRPPSGALAALFVLAGSSLRRPRALPAHPMTTQLGRVQLRFLG
ncbi:MAG: hypothetical protein LBE78_10180 [Burkholderiaceae bacterium]|nr:hypothetical protein [Burkholderiaceae bacterium]